MVRVTCVWRGSGGDGGGGEGETTSENVYTKVHSLALNSLKILEHH